MRRLASKIVFSGFAAAWRQGWRKYGIGDVSWTVVCVRVCMSVSVCLRLREPWPHLLRTPFLPSGRVFHKKQEAFLSATNLSYSCWSNQTLTPCETNHRGRCSATLLVCENVDLQRREKGQRVRSLYCRAKQLRLARTWSLAQWPTQENVVPRSMPTLCPL